MNSNNNNAGFGSSLHSKARRVRTRKALKVILVSLISLLLVITCAGVAIIMPLVQAYNRSYVEVTLIDRDPDYTFVIPPIMGDSTQGKPFAGENGNWWIGDFDTGIKVEYGEIQTDESGDEYTPIANEPIIGENGNWLIGSADTGVKADITTSMPEPPPVTTGSSGGSSSSGTSKPVTVNGIYKVEKIDPDIENILLVGTDSRTLSLSGRSDTMIVCSYNKRTGKAKLISFMRDTLVPIEGLGKNGGILWQRLNATFSLSGIACTINTINQLFGLDIQRFVIINFSGTEKLIDSCGGVNVSLTNTPNDPRGEVQWIQNSGYKVIKNSDGTYHLDGAAALIHMRQRYGSSDVQRTNRQRKVLMALFQQVVSSRDITEIYDLIRNAFNSKMFQTNIPLDEMINLAASVASNGANMSIGSHRIPTSYWSIRFSMSEQKEVTSGGAQVLSINFNEQKAKVKEFVYGK